MARWRSWACPMVSSQLYPSLFHGLIFSSSYIVGLYVCFSEVKGLVHWSNFFWTWNCLGFFFFFCFFWIGKYTTHTRMVLNPRPHLAPPYLWVGLIALVLLFWRDFQSAINWTWKKCHLLIKSKIPSLGFKPKEYKNAYIINKKRQGSWTNYQKNIHTHGIWRPSSVISKVVTAYCQYLHKSTSKKYELFLKKSWKWFYSYTSIKFY